MSSSSMITLNRLRATVHSVRSRRVAAPKQASPLGKTSVHFLDLVASTDSDSEPSDSDAESESSEDDSVSRMSFLSANSSQTSLSSCPSASASATPARQVPRLDMACLMVRPSYGPASASPKAPTTNYLYKGGSTSVVTGGVMLGSPVSPAAKTGFSSPTRVKSAGANSASWRRL